MASTFNIKRNDTSPIIAGTCKDSDGTAIDITGATIRFHLINAAGTTVVDAAGAIVSATAGTVSYTWQTADTTTSGNHTAEFEVTYSGGAIETFPNRGFIPVRIYDDLL